MLWRGIGVPHPFTTNRRMNKMAPLGEFVNLMNHAQLAVSSTYSIFATYKITYGDMLQNAMNQRPIGEIMGKIFRLFETEF